MWIRISENGVRWKSREGDWKKERNEIMNVCVSHLYVFELSSECA